MILPTQNIVCKFLSDSKSSFHETRGIGSLKAKPPNVRDEWIKLIAKNTFEINEINMSGRVINRVQCNTAVTISYNILSISY